MVKVPKYVCDVSDDILWLPKRFWEGSVISQAYCICDWYDGWGADAGMQQKGYGNWKMLIFQRGELGGMGGTKSHGCREHRRTPENAQDEILCNTWKRRRGWWKEVRWAQEMHLCLEPWFLKKKFIVLMAKKGDSSVCFSFFPDSTFFPWQSNYAEDLTVATTHTTLALPDQHAAEPPCTITDAECELKVYWMLCITCANQQHEGKAQATEASENIMFYSLSLSNIYI